MAPPTVVHLIPHTHWDREWYLPRAAFGVRLVAMLDELVPLLESHRSLRYTLDGQTVLLADYLAVRPGMRSRIVRLVRRGQLAVGPWYVLADELIPSAAGLRRNLAIGLADGRALGGSMRVLYSPDAFGHPHWLPSLAVEFGLRWCVLWRGLAGNRERGPDLVRWRGPAGRAVLLHHLPPEGYEVGAHLPGLAGPALRTEWPRLRDRLIARSVTRHVALPIGADHHAAHPRLPGLPERLRRIDPGLEFRWSRWEDYFRSVERVRPRLRLLDGELRAGYGHTWALQGVHGSRARLKRRYAEAEHALTEVAEPLARLASGKGGADRTAQIQSAWRQLVECQFHDTLAGTVGDETAREQAVRLEGVAALCDAVIDESVRRLAGHDPDRARGARPAAPPALLLWNASLRGHRGVVTAEVPFFRRDVPVGPPGRSVVRRGTGAPGFALRRGGRLVPVQVLGVETGLDRRDARYHYPDLDEVDRVAIAFDPGLVPGRRTVRLEVAPGRAPRPRPRGAARGSARRIENPLVRVTVTRRGAVTLLDQRTGVRYRSLLTLSDAADRGDLYTPQIDPVAAPRPEIVDIETLARGPLVARLAVRWHLRSAGRGLVTGTTTLTVCAGSPALHCRLEIDNRARDHRLRLRFPVGVAGPVLAGAGTGVVERPGGREERAVGEWRLPTDPAHELVAVGDRRRGLLLRHRGFFEYECGPTGVLSLTLLRSVGQLSRPDLPARPGHAAWPVATPEAQEPGRHSIRFALVPLSGLGSLRHGSRIPPFEAILSRSLR